MDGTLEKCGARAFLAGLEEEKGLEFVCGLPREHKGPHKDIYPSFGDTVEATWTKDQRFMCPKHGPQPIRLNCNVCYEEKRQLAHPTGLPADSILKDI